MERGFSRGLSGPPNAYYQPVPQECGLLDGQGQDTSEGQRPAPAVPPFEIRQSLAEQSLKVANLENLPLHRKERRSPRHVQKEKPQQTRLLHRKNNLGRRSAIGSVTKPFHERFGEEVSRIKECSREAVDEMFQCLQMFHAMALTHLFELIVTVISYCLCVGMGAVHTSLVDPSFFKATGLLLAVLLSLRAKMAMSRRQKLMNGILSMMNSAKNILELTGNENAEKRRRLRMMLSFSFSEIASWVMMDDNSSEAWLDVLPQEDRDFAFVLRSKYRLHTSPRALLVYLRQFCDELFDPDVEKLRSAARTTDLMEGLATDARFIAEACGNKPKPAAPVLVESHRAPTPPTEGSDAGKSSSSADVAAGGTEAGAAPVATSGGDAPASQPAASPPLPEERVSKSDDDLKCHVQFQEVFNCNTGLSANLSGALYPGIDPDKIDKVSLIRRWHRNVDLDLQNICGQFDTLLMYKEELHTAQFRWMLSSVILLYVALYPWCVRHESTLVLGGTTIGMAFVFYGLNAMTEQLEDPVAQHQQGFDLTTIFQAMFEKMEKEEAVRTEAIKFLQRRKMLGHDVTEDLHEEFEESLMNRTDLWETHDEAQAAKSDRLRPSPASRPTQVAVFGETRRRSSFTIAPVPTLK